MTKYKCGHEIGLVIIDGNILSMSGYFEWKETVGLDGTRELCWDCYNKKEKNELA